LAGGLELEIEGSLGWLRHSDGAPVI
jgi:hypothetical protein